MLDLHGVCKLCEGRCILWSDFLRRIKHLLNPVSPCKGQLQTAPAGSNLDDGLIILLGKLSKRGNQANCNSRFDIRVAQ